MFEAVHHIAIIATDYQRSRAFYRDSLGFTILAETFRDARNSWKCDLRHGVVQIELFSFPDPPPRPNRPEAAGLRHLAFTVADLDTAIGTLNARGVVTEPICTDELTGKRFTFFADPDGLPLELYEA
ncbi:SMU1112c/YaeR family gloxylase I-like metalloprotein [Lichenifustis flavocetrariae]|uniref:VOC family protein n=1 Tax=Lichenifustis flavocetrariae TaxID=2949735 RepID=A0AA41YZC2_9HYPH|nr:VOC family protein [Lichenifustis flavocetrariae]MCW6510076.1 VOC family protein [Lichenifustis flavocetrariae]